VVDGPDGPVGKVDGRRDETDPAISHLMAMWVHPWARSSGAADNLVAARLARADSEAALYLRLDVIADNARARRFYQRLGFRPTGQESARQRDGRTEIHMSALSPDHRGPEGAASLHLECRRKTGPQLIPIAAPVPS
jgi:RimJ/RimL family protein N-acetyltransferase